MRHAFLLRLVVVLAVSAVVPAVAPGVGAQATPDTITATVYTCPPGMTAETLVPGDCSLVTEGFDLTVVSLTGLQSPLTLADASFDGTSYTWSPGPAALSSSTGVNWGIRVSVKPAGYTTFDVQGDAVVGWDGRFVTLRITADAPDAVLSVYNFATAGPGSVTVRGFACPRGMTADTLDPDQCDPSDIPSMTVQYIVAEQTTLLALRDARYDGEAYLWSGLPLAAEGETEFALVVRDAPLGANGSIFVGDRVASHDGFAMLTLSVAEPSAAVRLYFFFAEHPMQDARVAPLACPSADADIDECEPLAGVEVAVEADGQPVEGSPFTTRYVFDVRFAVAGFVVPLDATLTLTEIGGLPEGYAPAPGYDPMTIAVRDLVRGSGGGGDAPGYYAYLVNVPARGFTLPAVATACQRMPTAGPFAGGDCLPVAGVSITYTTESGEDIASCVTAPLPASDVPVASCTVEVPYGSTVVATADASAFPEGYALVSPNPQTWHIPNSPPEGEFGGPVFVALPTGSPAPAVTPTPGQTAEPTPPVVGVRPAHIHPGTCTQLRQRPRISLNNVTGAARPPEGEHRATVAEESFTTINHSLSELLVTPHAIQVHKSAKEIDVYLVCGEIGGPPRPDGSLVVGLREYDGSGYEGIAYLAPHADDPAKTDVWVFIASKLAEEERSTPTPTATPETVASPAAG